MQVSTHALIKDLSPAELKDRATAILKEIRSDQTRHERTLVLSGELERIQKEYREQTGEYLD